MVLEKIILSDFAEEKGIRALDGAGTRATRKPQAHGCARVAVEGALRRAGR